MAKINESVMDDVLQEIGDKKSDIDDVIVIGNNSETKKNKTKIKEELDNLVGVYLTKEEKDSFQMLCSFNKKSVTKIARDLIINYIKKNKDLVDKLKDLEKFR